MNPQTIALIKNLATDFQPVVSVGIGAWIGAHLSWRNSLRTMQIQSNQRDEEWQREKKIKEKEALQAWFEDYTITKCVDLILADVALLNTLTATDSMRLEASKDITESPSTPFDACIRLLTITGASEMQTILDGARLMRYTKANESQRNAMRHALAGSVYYLLRLKQYLLAKEITGKTDIFKLSIEEHFQSIGDGINDLWKEVIEAGAVVAPETFFLADSVRHMAKHPDPVFKTP